MLKAIYFKNTY